jgi:DNA-binding MarR family transcriptional regulator
MERKFQQNRRYVSLSKLCAALSNPTRIAILDKIAENDSCVTGDFLEMGEVTKFTTGQNIKQLARLGLINGSFTKKTMSYCINYETLEEWKAVVDELYESWIKNKDKVNPTNAVCANEVGTS